MIRLTIGNSFSRIEGLSTSQFKALRQKLSYQVDPNEAYHSGLHKNDRRYLIDKKGDFPTGLLHYAKEGLAFAHIEDKRRQPKGQLGMFSMKGDGLIPRPEQMSVSDIAAEVHRGVIRMPTATGKSLTMGLLIERLKVKTLIIVPTTALKEQLRTDMRAWFGPTPNIVVENIDSSALSDMTQFDCLILDEAHHAAAKTYRDLNKKAWKNIYYRFFFTATPFRSNSEEQLLMESITGEVIYQMTYQQAVSAGYIVPLEAYYLDIPPVECDSNHWRTVYNTCVVNHETRNEIIKSLITRLEASGASVLCLLREISHGQEIATSTGFPFANGQDGMVRQRILEFNLRETKAMIGTVGVLGEGIDTRPAEYIIIAGAGKSRVQLMQNIGRGLRLYPGKDSCKVILLRDTSHKFLRRHFNQSLVTLREEYGIKPIKLILEV